MNKYLIALVLTLASASAYAACRDYSYTLDGRHIMCRECCGAYIKCTTVCH